MIVDEDLRVGCHWLLLRLAGHVHDDLIAQCRRWVAEAELSAVGRAVYDTVLTNGLRLSVYDMNLVADLIATAGVNSGILPGIEITDVDQVPVCGFVPGRARLEMVLGLASDTDEGESGFDPRPEDAIDEAALAAVTGDRAVRSLWRTWRYPGEVSRLLSVRRVYVLECDTEADLPTITSRTQAALAAAGEIDPQVEVFPMLADLPPYHRLARASGTLMWNRVPDSVDLEHTRSR